MVTTHSLGFPRIGSQRQLKFALEKYWRGEIDANQLQGQAAELRQQHWGWQQELSYVPVGDFSFYDQVLDMSFTLGNVPKRIENNQGLEKTGSELAGSELDRYFRVARGRSRGDSGAGVQAGEMTKWFDSNYHYIVPEFDAETSFSLNPTRLLAELEQSRQHKLKAKPVIIGPLTYLFLGKEKDNSNKLDLLEKLLPVYGRLLDLLAEHGVEWVQIDEPILVTELAADWQLAFKRAYQQLSAYLPKLLLCTYFGELKGNLNLTCELPVQGLHLDAINARAEVTAVLDNLGATKVLSLGVVNGRNIWRCDLNKTLSWLKPVYEQLQERLWLAPSCSLLHVPVDLDNETELDAEVKSWMAFALQKLQELKVLAKALTDQSQVSEALAENRVLLAARQQSNWINQKPVQQALKTITPHLGQRQSDFKTRSTIQEDLLDLPLFPTTTIGSFPQTKDIRAARLQYRQGTLKQQEYVEKMQAQIRDCIKQQEDLGLDVLVHGEAERNDMVEYFGEQLQGFVFSRFAWVQSYGSRCVKPPIIVGDISRPKPMTVDWTRYAQTLTEKPVKGMLTGPVTILNWSFVRDDQARSETCYQIALAIREEVQDLEKAGHQFIQIDEAALREGLPLRKSEWQDYLQWAVESFRIAANGVKDETQIHTHMCYSDFNDIIESISDMDADVITIETSRSDMELLDAFDNFDYPNDIGPGVYDIHSPNIPSKDEMVLLMEKAAEKIPAKRLWVNPDCGLKTRQWQEVMPALQSMVAAAKRLREKYSADV